MCIKGVGMANLATKTKTENSRSVYGIFLGVLSIVLGAAFIVQVWRIFYVGERAFTAARVRKYFWQIAPIVFAWIEAVIGGAVLHYIYPKSETLPAYKNESATLARLSRLLPSGQAQSAFSKKRNTAWIICLSLCLALFAAGCVFFFTPFSIAEEGFFAEHEESVRLVLSLPWFVVLGCIWSGVWAYESKNKQREIAAVKKEIAENAKNGVKVRAATSVSEKPCWISEKLAPIKKFCANKWFTLGVRIALVVLAVVFVITGIAGGGMDDVFEKAVNICTQCIGLG